MNLVLLSVFALHCLLPASAATVNLPFGDVNVVILTDVHSWVAGHGRHEPSMDIDYGDVVSFVELLQEAASDKDIFFVMNGDFVDGTGLSIPYPPTHLTPILKFMPWDALNIGNHELYHNSNIKHITKEGGFVDHWKGRYLTSNVVMESTREPIGNRFTYLKGKNTGASILTFGFLYDFENHCNITDVERVEDVVESPWFIDELEKGDFDAILVLAHMDVQDPLVYVLWEAMRSIVGENMPIQFVTGHTHYRGFKTLDETSVSFEAGRYLDTVGFASFPIKNNTSVVVGRNDTNANMTNTTTTTAPQFQQVWLDANIDTLKQTLAVDDMTTQSGLALSSLIQETRQDLGLNDVVGCSTQRLYLEHGLDKQDSLWAFYLQHVVLRNYFHYNTSQVLIQGTGSFRYDLVDGNITRDDVIAVAPFPDNGIYKFTEHTLGADILKAFGTPNFVQENATIINGRVVDLPKICMTGTIHEDQYYDLYTQEFSLNMFQEMLQNVTNSSLIQPQKQFHSNGITPVTTLSLWMDFIETHWSCENPEAVQVANRWLIVLFSIAAACLFFGYRIYRHVTLKRRRRGYDNAAAIEEAEEDMIL